MRTETAVALACLSLAACADRAVPTAPDATGTAAIGPVSAITRQFPAEDPGPPLYAILEPQFVLHTEEWAAIVFVRNPACVPGGFNLLQVVNVPAAFGCPVTVSGHVTYKNGVPPIDPAPQHVLMQGNGAVPVWFVAWPELELALADNLLTTVEILAMGSLRVGTASQFEMTQHPGAVRPQGAGNGKIELVARGSLLDGTSFSVQVREMGVDQVSVLRHVAIEFR